MGAWVSFWLPFQDGHIRLLSFFGKVGVCFGAEVDASEVHFGKKWSRFVFGWEMAFLFKKKINFYVVLRLPSAQVCESCDPQIDGIQHQLEADLLLARGCFSLYGDEARGASSCPGLSMEGMQWIIIRLLRKDLDLFPPQSKKPST